MTVHLDHLMVPSRNKVASTRLLAELLGVPWSEAEAGPFISVYVNDGLTLDFDEWTEPEGIRRHSEADQSGRDSVPQCRARAG